MLYCSVDYFNVYLSVPIIRSVWYDEILILDKQRLIMKNKFFTSQRNYAFVDLNDNGSMRVTVSRKLNDGYERDGFTIPSETMKEICSVLQSQSNASPQLQQSPNPVSSYTLEQKRMEQGKKAYLPWTEEDDAKLIKMLKQDYSIQEIATVLQRGTGAIVSRMNKLLC